MIYRISAIRTKQLPSKFKEGTWTLTEVKLDGEGDKTFTLKGFGKQKIEKGSTVNGYITEREFNTQNGPMKSFELNKLSADYVYDLLISKFPDIEIEFKRIKNNELKVETEDSNLEGW